MESGKVREPRRTALPLGSVLGFMEEGFISGLPCPNTLLVSVYGLTQGFSRWHAALPVKTDSSREFPGGWQDILCMAQHLLPLFRPSQILRVGNSLSFPCSLLEPSRERQLVQVVVFMQKFSVRGSLTLFHLNAKVDLLLTIFQMKKLGYSGCIVFSGSLDCMLCLP